MKLLVTGAGGFIGSHVCERLVAEGHSVRAFVHYNSAGHWGHLEASPVKSELEVHAGDVRDFDSVLKSMRGVDGVLHLAALIGIPYSYDSPKAYIDTNITGTYNVLEAARLLDTQRVVLTSTSETYGTAQYVPIDELHPINPQSPYAATKASADALGLSYHKSFGTPVTVLRPFNTYGPRQSARAIIPTIMTQLLAGQRQIKLGNLTATRDLNFVEDTAEAFLAVLKNDGALGQALNAGSNFEISIGDLAQAIITEAQLPYDVEILVDPERLRPQNSEVERLWASAERLTALTGWQPRHTLAQGLQKTYRWLEQHLGDYKPGQYMK